MSQRSCSTMCYSGRYVPIRQNVIMCIGIQELVFWEAIAVFVQLMKMAGIYCLQK